MGKQSDVLNILEKHFNKNIKLCSVDLDVDPNDVDFLIAKAYLEDNIQDVSLSDTITRSIGKVFSGSKQVMKMESQRFTRLDFFGN